MKDFSIHVHDAKEFNHAIYLADKSKIPVGIIVHPGVYNLGIGRSYSEAINAKKNKTKTSI